MPLLPLLERVESRFDAANSIKWCGEHWKVALYACAAYLLVVFTGRRWMQNRPAYSLRLPLTMWNAGKRPFIKLVMIGASAASPVLARSKFMPTLFVCMSSTDLYVCHRPTGRIAHAQKHAKHML